MSLRFIIIAKTGLLKFVRLFCVFIIHFIHICIQIPLTPYMKYLLAIMFSLGSITLSAQNFWVDVFAGAMNYQGDLQDKRYTFDQAHLAGGAGITFDMSTHFVSRLHFLFGKISADDKYGKNSERNVNFTSSIIEGQAALQYYFYPLNSRSITPYVFAGVAVYHFNPYTRDTTEAKYFLKPLSTEGQGFVQGRNPYKLTQVAIPFGAGLKLSLTDDINVGLELGLRKTFTDYIDDVSKTYIDESVLLANRGPKAVELAFRGGEIKSGVSYPDPNFESIIRGNPKSLDLYYFTAVSVSFRISDANKMVSARAKWQKKFECPSF